MAEVKVRGLSLDTKLKLKEKAQLLGFTSLNAYIVYQLEKIAHFDGITEQEMLLREQNTLAVECLRKNTDVLLQVLAQLK